MVKLILSVILRHDSHNKVSMAEKFSVPLLGIEPGSPQYNAKSTLCRYIGESALPVTLPLVKGVIIYDDGKPFRYIGGSAWLIFVCSISFQSTHTHTDEGGPEQTKNVVNGRKIGLSSNAYRGTNMIAHVLLYLLNELRKSDKM